MAGARRSSVKASILIAEYERRSTLLRGREPGIPAGQRAAKRGIIARIRPGTFTDPAAATSSARRRRLAPLSSAPGGAWAGTRRSTMATRGKRLTPAERRRRPRRRMTVADGCILVGVGGPGYFASRATATVVFVRHADVDDPLALENDPPLNATGRARADLLSRFLQYLDVVGGVNAIYAAPYRRAEETAAPLADRLGLMIMPAVFEDTEAFMEEILKEHKGEIVLFVVDRDAIAPMIEELHGSKRVPEIAPDEYENIYVVTVPWGGGAKV